MANSRASGPMWKGRDELLKLWSTAQKILSQELRIGCADRTVYGGLEKFLANWSASLSSLETSYPTWPEARHVTGLLQAYGQRSPEERAERVRGALDLIAEVLHRVSTLSAPSESARALSVADEAAGLSPRRRAGLPVDAPPKSRGRGEASTASPSPASRVLGSARPRAPRTANLALDDPILAVKGVGKQRASLLAKLGIQRIRDLLLHFPRDYRDFRPVKRIAELMYGETASIVGVVEDVQVVPGPHKRVRTTLKVRDDSGRIAATWFRYGYAGMRLAPNSRIALAGTTSGYGGYLSFESPDWEPADRPPLHTRRLVPVYPLTEGVSDYWLRELMAEVVPSYAPRLEEYLPEWLIRKYGLASLPEAVARVHFPNSQEELDEAKGRLAFDELFLVQVAALKSRAEWQSGSGAPGLRLGDDLLEGFLGSQPFALTGAQRRVVGEILADLGHSRPMTRLLQGEVGSGKTIVAAVAMLAAVAGGYQVALMAPTEILAEQHARTLSEAFGRGAEALLRALGRPLRLELLTGASRKAERERVYRGVADGEVDVLVGTQAIIQEGLGFRRLGLAVIDEQHRFGVAQRSALREKGGTPHLLVMTATPIPRTMALVIYGDLDLSVIDELPPGRQPVRTHLLRAPERKHAYERIRREVEKGRQAFIICPLVEDSPHLEVRAATGEYERLQRGELSGLRLALLHGRMRPAEKDRIMLDFRNGDYDVLVSTSVVEVGIDVPNATVMLVEGADRFGLAQLHQFRGRVGRGQYPSDCILLTDASDPEVLDRLQMVAAVSDGFKLADEDLRLRGPGEYFGLRQSGFPDFRMADLRDLRLIERAREAATELLGRDPELSRPEHRALAQKVEDLRMAGSS
ncbi:MAG: ATP-dependent DNA helicase RecG [Sphingomonadaceae bacterium]